MRLTTSISRLPVVILRCGAVLTTRDQDADDRARDALSESFAEPCRPANFEAVARIGGNLFQIAEATGIGKRVQIDYRSAFCSEPAG